jgi:hypothetical protein
MTKATNKPGPDDSIILDLSKDDVIEPKGAVEDAISRRIDEPSSAEGWKYLAPGSSMSAPAGSAYYIKTKDGWILSQFFDKGRMFGPLVFAKTQIETPVEALRRKENINLGEDIVYSGILSVMALIFLFIGAPDGNIMVFLPWSVGLFLLAILRLHSILPILLGKNGKVLKTIKDKYSYSRKEFTPPSKPLPVDVIED